MTAPVSAMESFELASLKRAFLARPALALLLAVVLLVCFGWRAALATLLAGAGASLLGWIAFKAGDGPRARLLRYGLVALEVGLIIAAFFVGDLLSLKSWPPAPMVFYSPAALLLVCLLALNAITARPGVVWWTGACVLIGWWIAGQIVLADPATLTKDGIDEDKINSLMEYLVLLGRPHFFNRDVFTLELTAIACCTVALAIAAHRTRALVGRAAKQHALRSGLAAHFSGAVIDALLAARAAHAGTTRTLVVIDCDLVGFSGRARVMTPDAVARALRAYHGFIEGLVFDAGGGVLKFTGDGVTAVFGMTGEAGPAAVAAIACARKIVDAWPAAALKAFPDDPAAIAIAVGVDAGPVAAGLAGEGRAMSLMVAGPAVDGAAALQAATRAAGVTLLISDAALALAAPVEG
jgi:class 3 adenylate cyclase